LKSALNTSTRQEFRLGGTAFSKRGIGVKKRAGWLKALKKEHIVLLLVNLALIAVFGSLFLRMQNYEFVIYVGVIIFFLCLVGISINKIDYTLASLVGLTIWSALHLAGGGIILVMAGLGMGALNEIVEFIVSSLVPRSGVGGYINTALDLCADLVGALLGLLYIRWRYLGDRKTR
jgi:hypothetical protein